MSVKQRGELCTVAREVLRDGAQVLVPMVFHANTGRSYPAFVFEGREDQGCYPDVPKTVYRFVEECAVERANSALQAVIDEWSLMLKGLPEEMLEELRIALFGTGGD